MRIRLARVLAWLLLAGGAAAAGEEPIQKRLATASPQRGQALSTACRACHSVGEGGEHTLGPNLRGVIERPVASAKGYGRYTPALASLG